MSESRRGFIKDAVKVVVPGGWALDLRKGGGLGGLSPAGRVGLAKDIILATGGVMLSTSEKSPKTFRERVTTFGWDHAKGNELVSFESDVADEYLKLTKSPRVTKDDLMNTLFVDNRADFVRLVTAFEPDYNPAFSVWGRTNFATRQIFIDLATLKDQALAQTPLQYKGTIDPNKTAGRALLQGLWHEWTRLDVAERQSGQFINNPQIYFDSPNSGKKEQFKKYRGGTVYTDTYTGYSRFDSVWNQTIVIKRMIEQAGLDDWVVIPSFYFENGTDFFPAFVRAVGISLDTLYQMHATSDFEAFMDLVGQKLPGNAQALIKGEKLFTAIHKSDRKLLDQTGALTLLPKKAA